MSLEKVINPIANKTKRIDKRCFLKCIKIDNRIALNLKLNSYLDDKCQEVLKNYIKTTSEMNNYQNCLAYYLGLSFFPRKSIISV